MGMVDLHCHLLPGVDDGARTMEDALALASAAVANGITRAVLTPHVYPGVFDNKISTILPTFRRYRAALAAAGIPLEIYLGGEVRIHPDMFQLLAADELPVLGLLGKERVVLLELPDGHIPPGVEVVCRMFCKHGIRLLIAHPERNKQVMRDPKRIRRLVDSGCLLQVTAASIVGAFGPQVAACAQHLLVNRLVSVVATDAHNLRHRPPLLKEARDALSRQFGPDLACQLTEGLPGEIITARTD